jgi:putative ABC transport system ATP-binding protein
MTAVLELEQVRRVYGSGHLAVAALDGVSLAVASGELVAVMGPSGAGKSTLLNLAGGLDGRGLAALRRRRVGYVFQDVNLLPGLTAAENVALPRELDGVRTRDARAEALAALELVGLSGRSGAFPDELSGGERQRVAIARAVAGERVLLLADEPTGALDALTGEAVLGVLRARCDDGIAGVLVTHEARYAGWADRVVFLADGRVVDQTGRSTGAPPWGFPDPSGRSTGAPPWGSPDPSGRSTGAPPWGSPDPSGRAAPASPGGNEEGGFR